MPRALRIFISSTMQDLANERDEVRRRLIEFNFEPVNAEGLLPTGQGSWDRIAGEIVSSDLFVVILGDTYGWIPPSGPMHNLGKSVTELEFLEANARGLPVFVFSKRLSAHMDATSEDSRRREAFRSEVESWDGGYFRTDFELASELANKVGRALVAFLSDAYQVQRLSPDRAASVAG